MLRFGARGMGAVDSGTYGLGFEKLGLRRA